jgi:hypothetical protein
MRTKLVYRGALEIGFRWLFSILKYIFVIMYRCCMYINFNLTIQLQVLKVEDKFHQYRAANVCTYGLYK